MVGRSREREEIYDFTFPYYVLHGAVFVRKGTSEINTLEDLKVKDILVMKGDNAEEYVLRENISSNVISTDNYETAFRLLESGGYDTVIAQELMGLHLLNILGIDNIIPLELDLPGFSQDFSFAVHNGNTNLLAKLNEGLAIVIANGRYDEIHKKWLVPIEKQAPITFKELLKVLIYVIPTILILISLIAILVLRFEVKRRTKALKKEVSVRKQAEQAIEQQLSEKEIILKEVHHRIKNNFTTIGNLLSLQANSIENPDANFILQDAISRVNSMSILYENLLLSKRIREM
jgi:signal transduction histidine kinase